MTRRERAQATLNGLVNDWVAEAQRLARDVVDLTDEAEDTARAHAVEVEAFLENAAALGRRMDAAGAAAEDAAAARDAALGERDLLAVRVTALEYATQNLCGRIVEVTDGPVPVPRDRRWVFRPDSGDSIRSFRKVVRSDDAA